MSSMAHADQARDQGIAPEGDTAMMSLRWASEGASSPWRKVAFKGSLAGFELCRPKSTSCCHLCV